MLLDSEIVLVDDYPIITGYVYIVDGVVTRAETDMTVGIWRQLCPIKEIRRCEIFGHDDIFVGDHVVEVK